MIFDRNWKEWLPDVRKGQLLRLKSYVRFANEISGPGHQTLQLDEGDIVMFLNMKQVDWEMSGGPRGEMCHERRDYKLEVLYGEKIWQTGVIIVEGNFSGFDLHFEVLENE